MNEKMYLFNPFVVENYKDEELFSEDFEKVEKVIGTIELEEQKDLLFEEMMREVINKC